MSLNVIGSYMIGSYMIICEWNILDVSSGLLVMILLISCVLHGGYIYYARVGYGAALQYSLLFALAPVSVVGIRWRRRLSL